MDCVLGLQCASSMISKVCVAIPEGRTDPPQADQRGGKFFLTGPSAVLAVQA